MINIGIFLDIDGNLSGLKAEGHSMTAGKGSNIVCAAVSAQLRSVVRVLETGIGLNVEVAADEPGNLELFVQNVSGCSEWLKGVTDVLLAGLLETERDYPRDCSVKLLKNDLRS